jgi:hypothetical protein
MRKWREEDPLYPILLGGATPTPDGGLLPVGPVVPVFNFQFSTNVTGNRATLFPSFGVVGHKEKHPKKPPVYTEAEVLRRRADVLGRYFPITTDRSGDAKLLADDPSWPTLQAVCNLTLSREITGGAFYVGVPGDDLSSEIEQHLRSRVETRPIVTSGFSDENLEKQIALDRVSYDRYRRS